MASPRGYLDLTVAEWLDELARSRGAPGGGSMLGIAVATAASVLAMAARVSEDGGLAAQADALRARSAPLAQRDADTYDAALAVRDATEALRPDRRDWEIGQAFARAAEPPLEIARVAADITELAAQLAAAGDPRVRADAVAAAALAAGAARGAVALVTVNLTMVEGDPRAAEAERLARGAGETLAQLLQPGGG
jgi:formiminotetrahydrofolate cyclodeaminase